MPKNSVIEENAGLHEAEMGTALSRMEAVVEDCEFDPDTLMGDVRDCILEIIKTRPKPWGELGAGEQQDVVRSVEYASRNMISRAVDSLASLGKQDPVKAILETLSEKKDGTIEVKLKIKTTTDEETAAAFLALHHSRGKMVLVTKASAEDYSGQRGDAPIDPDQNGFEFEGGNDLDREDQ